jgi:protein O-GlcNAc transferase
MSRKHRSLPRRAGPPQRSTLASLLQQAAAAHGRGLLVEAEQLYRSVLRSQPRHFDSHHRLGIIAIQSGRHEEGVALLQRAVQLNCRHGPAQMNLANALLHARRNEEALQQYERALEINPGSAVVLSNRGTALQLLNRHAEAAQAFAQLIDVAPEFDFAVGSRFCSLRQCCDWRDFASQSEGIVTALQAGARADRPFSFLSVSDSAARQRECARIYAEYLCPHPAPALWRGERYGHARIRIAYVSADFRDHVMSYFMTPIYERHDVERFHTIGVSLGADDDSEIARRGKHALAQFVNVAGMSDPEAAALLRELEIDIAVDLTGFTQGCRPGIFARRPAPVQVSFLGFPATMGMSSIDYLVADGFVIPESHENRYSEKIVRLSCFQPSDTRRAPLGAGPLTSRTTAGLPESALVLCCFNNSYKINPRFFGIWARLMQRAPHSVLWLLGEDAVTRGHLCAQAAAHGIAPERVIFAARVPYAEHLARLPLADLFLDTLPFNAGATASDVLWAGVPLLTCAGDAFAARMAGSLLQTLGLPELVTFSEAEYEQRALELACDPQELGALRARLAASPRATALFDSARYCRDLEAAYLHMSACVARGEPPASFSVARPRAAPGF